MQVLSKTRTSSNCRHENRIQVGETIGDLFRDYGEKYIETYRPNLHTIKLIRSIRLCRTPALGGQKMICEGCGSTRYQYHSCGNNQCPQCQGLKRKQWEDRLSIRMLSVPYVHTTFTLPHELNGLAKRNQEKVYGLLFRSAWKTISQLCGDEKNVGGRPGMTSVLHTWGSDLKYHIHIHCLITFGGLKLEPAPKWCWPKRKKKLAKYRQMCSTYRSIFLKELKKLMKKGELVYHRTYEEMEQELINKRWVVNNTHPTADTKVIEEYLSRYICRIGITNSRLSYDREGKNVEIKYNDYRNQKKGKAAPKAYRNLNPLLAMQMILQHQVPRYFQRVRHYGLHAGSTYKKIQGQLPAHLKRNGATVRTILEILKALLQEEPNCCLECGGLDFEVVGLAKDEEYLKQIISIKKRGPPSEKVGTKRLKYKVH